MPSGRWSSPVSSDAGADRADRAAGNTHAARRGPLLPAMALVAAAVIAGVIIVGALAGYL